MHQRHRGDKKYSHLEQGMHGGQQYRNRENSNSSRYCPDPVKLLEKGPDDAFISSSATLPISGNHMPMEIPVDEDDYLMPSPVGRGKNATYMIIIPDSIPPDGSKPRSEFSQFVPDLVPQSGRTVVPNGHPPNAIDNMEYHMMNRDDYLMPPVGIEASNVVGLPNVAITANGKGPVRKLTGSSDEDTDHEYYNDFDRLKHEKQPLNHRNETTV